MGEVASVTAVSVVVTQAVSVPVTDAPGLGFTVTDNGVDVALHDVTPLVTTTLYAPLWVTTSEDPVSVSFVKSLYHS